MILPEKLRSYIVCDRSFYRMAAQIMVPVMLQQAINIGVNMMDSVMLGSFGEAQLSASSLANSFYSLFIYLYMGIFSGCSVLAAQYWGAGDSQKVKESVNLSVRLAVLASVLFSAATALFPREIMYMYTDEADVVEYGVRYLRITACVYFFHGVGQVLTQMMRTINKAKLGLYASVFSFFVNIFFNWVFIFGRLGAPRMEIAGAALGTLIARLSEFLIAVIYIFFVDKELSLRLRDMLKSPTKELFHNYLRLGLAVLASDTLLGLGTNGLNMVLGRMGSTVVAANAVCQVIDRLFTVVVSGTSSAAGILTGNTIGRGERDKVQLQGQTFYLISVVIGLFCAAMVLIFGTLSIRLYELEPETVSVAGQMMLAYSFVVIFQSIQSVMTKGVLRGGGDTKFLLVADILFLWAVSLPLGCLAGLVLGAPAWLTIICLRIDFVIKSVWCISRLRSGKWIRRVERLDAALPSKIAENKNT